ncbi:DUF2206 domain-containing protein [Natronorubrum texcoconense]|uniref:Uncharacterized membrane protein n=1 Tax=Natronorubrum texcoconense TaxID=1095776 RepID=A0A1G9E846_9EURY|nr:DUF2206 domain-containing protein [Natronorubrum texcoconense]SDK72294.1 Uncharacterized membrane protein [Natronorubrum texcoconense]
MHETHADRRGTPREYAGALLFCCLQVAFLGWIGMAALGFDLPIVRAAFVFLYLTFVPGFVLVRLLNVDVRSVSSLLVLTVGSSLVFSMALGAIVNVAYPLFGIARPMAPLTLALTIVVSVSALYVLAALRRDAVPSVPRVDGVVTWRTVRYAVPLLTLPVLSAVASHYGSATGEYRINLVVLVVLCLVPLVAYVSDLPASAYPLAIWTVSLAILFQFTMVSTHVVGFDIHYEYYTANAVQEQARWYPQVTSIGNSLLSIAVLPAMYAILANVEVAWIFKAVVPFFFSLAPLCVYHATIHVFDRRDVGFLAAFVFVAYYSFFKDMPDKQHMAILFLGFLLVAATDPRLSQRVKLVLSVAFLGGIVTSHYATSFILIGLFAPVAFVDVVSRYRSDAIHVERTAIFVGVGLWVYFVLFNVLWYGTVSEGTNLELILAVSAETLTNVEAFMATPESRSGVDYATRDLPGGALWEWYRLLNVVLLGLVSVGLLATARRVLVERVIHPYHVFAAGCYALIAVTIVLPFDIGFDRILQLALFVLAPYLIVGAVALATATASVLESTRRIATASNARKAACVFIVVYLLFSTGAGFALAGDETPPYAIYLDDDNWEEWNVAYPSELAAAEWVSTHSQSDEIATLPGPPNHWWHNKDFMILSGYYEQEEFVWFERDTDSVPPGTCIYLGNEMSDDGRMPYFDTETETLEHTEFAETTFYEAVVVDSNRVYDSGSATIYGC